MVLGIIAATTLAAASARERVLIDSGWRFQPGDPGDVTTNVTVYPEINDLGKLQSGEINAETALQATRPDPVATHAGENVSFVKTNYNDSAWRTLDLPHDWVVELGFTSSGDGNHGFKATSGNTIAWYRRTFTLPAGDAGKVMWLDFDGIYRNALIWFNGHCIGRDVSGYAPISFDVTPYVNAGGTNVLIVRVDATRTEGWFYEGGGIYRHVWLVKTDPVHVGHWGTYVATTSLVGSNATITMQTTVTNQSVLVVTGSLTSAILDANSNSVTATNSALTLAAGQGLIVTQTLAVVNANLWSLQTPYLYNLVSTVSNQTAVADVYQTPFGVRTVRFDATNGVFINGQRVEVQGMCNHQDHAGVGSALPDRLQYFRIERLKQMGVNAYRTSHNAPTPELLEACDRLGMLVLDETRRFGYDPETLGQLERMIRRDRNHPSVFCWSLANEESLQGDASGATVMQAMQNLAHSLDSTRLCTAAMSGGWGSGFSTVLDVQGFNYNNGGLDGFHSSYPTQRSIGTETASTVTTRGIYTTDNPAGYLAAYDIQDSRVGWGSTAEAWWSTYSARPWVAGGFAWTGFDYRGEPTPFGWPVINSHFGIMDTCGYPKDLFYYYQANWTIKPVLHILPHWNWAGKEGQPISVWVFGNCDLVELFLNGVSQGQQVLNVQGHGAWSVSYTSGTLQAVGYRNGQAVITNTVQTTGVPAAVALIPDRSTILADGRDVSVVTVAVLDSLDRVVPTATNLINFIVSGGTIIGVGNGNPSSHEADKASQRSVFNGLAQVIVQSTNQPGSIVLTASSTGLTSTNITITAAATSPAPAVPDAVAAVPTNRQNTISWDVVPGAITYNVKRSTTNGGSYSVIAANTAAIGFTDTDVTNLVNYYYVVSAVNANGESVNSIQVSGMPQLPPAPTVPTGLTATRGEGQVSLSWAAASGATSYNLKRSTTGGGPYPTVTNITTTSLVVTGLANGTPYYFVVSALNLYGESTNSSEVSATPAASVSGLTASVVNFQVQLQWNAHAGATGYNVKRAPASGVSYTMIASNLATTSFTDSTVSTCQTYYYIVTMMTGAVESVPSAEASVTVPGTLPSPLQSADIGSVTPSGSASYCGGQYFIAGSGGDIWGTSDAFQFAYVYVPISTNCEIRARVVSLDYTHSNAKAAVMIRESLAANSRHALADVEPGAGIEFLWRTNTGSTTTPASTSGAAPNWVRLTRTNNTFTASWSPDGNSWSQIGSASITMSKGAYLGLAVCSHKNGTLCSAVFDNVYISGIGAASSPVILQQPVGGTRYAGGAITLSAIFRGSTPLSYQWRQNGPPVSSGTSGGLTLSLPLSNLTTNQAGNYALSVTNSYGFTNTTAATLTVLAPTPGSYAEMIVTNGPVSCWQLNETGAPATAFDYLGGNDLANSSVVSTQGVQGFGFETVNIAAWYNGTTSGSAGSAPLMNSMTKFTICGWFKAVSMPQPSHTALFGQNDLAEFGFHNSALGIWIASPAAGGVQVTNRTAVLLTNTWYFVAATADGTNLNLYLNGSLLNSSPGTMTNYYSSTYPFRIGYGVLDATGNYFNGAIDEVALFNRALTASQLQALYHVAFAVPNVLMTIQPIGTNVTLFWSPAVGTLQAAPDVSGVYTNVPGATAPYTNPISGPQKFFRVRVQ